jgi:hypothetical protein
MEMFEDVAAVPLEPVPVVEPEPFQPSEELKKAIAKAKEKVTATFAARHPELGKMINCGVCGQRHREYDFAFREVRAADGSKSTTIVVRGKCTQVFTNTIGEYEFFREDETGKLVPAYRTAIDPDFQPTLKQVMGAAMFKGRRFNPHSNRYAARRERRLEERKAKLAPKGTPQEIKVNE